MAALFEVASPCLLKVLPLLLSYWNCTVYPYICWSYKRIWASVQSEFETEMEYLVLVLGNLCIHVCPAVNVKVPVPLSLATELFMVMVHV